MERDLSAGFAPRLIGYIIDTIFISLLAIVIALSLGLAMNLANEDIIELAYVASGLVTVPYVIGFWAFAGATPGKIMLGMSVVGPSGGTGGIGIGRAILRFFASLISAIPCYLGFIWILIDKDNQGWHDKIAGTRVIHRR